MPRPDPDTAARLIDMLDTVLDFDDVCDALTCAGYDAMLAIDMADTLVEDPDLERLTGDQRTEHIRDLITGEHPMTTTTTTTVPTTATRSQIKKAQNLALYFPDRVATYEIHNQDMLVHFTSPMGRAKTEYARTITYLITRRGAAVQQPDVTPQLAYVRPVEEDADRRCADVATTLDQHIADADRDMDRARAHVEGLRKVQEYLQACRDMRLRILRESNPEHRDVNKRAYEDQSLEIAVVESVLQMLGIVP